jgi:hypothetical protein
MCVCVYIHIRVLLYVCVYWCGIGTLVGVGQECGRCVCVCVFLCVYTYIHVCVCFVRMCILVGPWHFGRCGVKSVGGVYVCVCVHTYTCAFVRMCILVWHWHFGRLGRGVYVCRRVDVYLYACMLGWGSDRKHACRHKCTYMHTF